MSSSAPAIDPNFLLTESGIPRYDLQEGFDLPPFPLPLFPSAFRTNI
jgi:hypothetical protein